MRLIDADAEIARIGQEIQRIDAKIERLKKLIAKEPFNTLHVFEKELEQCYRNKVDCKSEIATIGNYQTAYDVDKVVEQLEERMCGLEDEATDIGCYMRNLHFRDAIEIVSSYILQSQNI